MPAGRSSPDLSSIFENVMNPGRSRPGSDDFDACSQLVGGDVGNDAAFKWKATPHPDMLLNQCGAAGRGDDANVYWER